MFATVTLEELRAYRGALVAEDARMAYWSTLVSARLDQLSERDISGAGHSEWIGPDEPGAAGAYSGSLRSALHEVVATPPMPPAPDVSVLAGLDLGLIGATSTLTDDLRRTQHALRRYRRALARRRTLATDELVARYRQTPSRCLGALPRRPDRYRRWGPADRPLATGAGRGTDRE